MFRWFGQRVIAATRSRSASLIRRQKHGASIKMGNVRQRNAIKSFSNRPEATIFERQGPTSQFRWGPWVAGGQLLLWINFADFYWRFSLEEDKETGQMKSLATWKRVCLSAVAVVAGLAIGGGILHYISRSVARMQILNGKTVRLDVFRASGRGTVCKQYPLESVYSRDTLYTGIGPAGLTKSTSSQYSLQTSGNKYAYILSRTGRFQDPKLFDLLFHRARPKPS